MSRLEYHRPTSVGEALGLLGRLGPTAVVAAGATDVWVNLRLKKIKPGAVVSLRNIPELNYLSVEGDTLRLGAATPHSVVEDSEWIGEKFPALRQACASVGSRQVRNVGTVGGNLCNAAPSADTAVALLLYDASLEIAGPHGTRTLPVAEFFRGPGVSALGPGELLTGISLKAPAGKSWSGYIKHTRRKAMELPLLGVGALVTLGADGQTVTSARFALGVAAPTPMRALAAEEFLTGKKFTPEIVAEAASVAAGEARVRDSWRARGWYRQDMIKVLIPRVFTDAGAF